MYEDSEASDIEDVDITFSDDEEFINDYHENQFENDKGKFMSNLLPNEELSDERQGRLTSEFSQIFATRYPLSGLSFFQGSFGDALKQSIFSRENPRPLILYIRHNKSLADNIFCGKFFNDRNIVEILNEDFIIWPWDRTDPNHYRELLKLLIKQVGSKIASEIASYSYVENDYPLLICLGFEYGQYTIIDKINSQVQDVEMMYSILTAIRVDFDRRNDQNSISTENLNDQWYIPDSHLTAITSKDHQYQSIVKNLNIEGHKIVKISTIENLIWSIKYSSEKARLDNRHEIEVFYACPLQNAQKILQVGFDRNTDQIHGNKYGSGFYFSTKRELCENYTVADELKFDPKAIIKCRVLLLDDRFNGSDTFVIDRNEYILPEYLITYKQ